MLPAIRRFSSDSSSASGPSSKRLRSQSQELLNSQNTIQVHIIQAKLDAQAIDELYSLIDSSHSGHTNPHGLKLERCVDVSHADIIVANVTMRRRLERHLDWKLAVSVHSLGIRLNWIH